jgi:hypothetical protein
MPPKATIAVLALGCYSIFPYFVDSLEIQERADTCAVVNVFITNFDNVLILCFFQTYVFLLISTGFWLMKALAGVYQVFQFWDIKLFYNQVSLQKYSPRLKLNDWGLYHKTYYGRTLRISLIT